MKHLSMDMLRAFVLVSDEGGFTAAAERLGRTQPAVSQQLKKLELMLGQPLLDRDGARLSLTPAGQTLMGYARQILALNDEAVGAFNKPAVSGRVRLGIPSEFAISLLPKIVSRFAKAYPDVTLEVTCDLSRNLTAENQRDHYDVVLSLHDKVAGKSRRFIKTDELVWVGSPRQAVNLHGSVPLIVAPDGCIYRKRALQKLQQANQPCRIVYTIPDLTGIQAAIEEGLGVTVLARSTVPDALMILHEPALPELGAMAIQIQQHQTHNSAIKLLSEFIKAGLS